jgi:pyruvate dehydrogenase E2 component (dihydrolipoamide acetyltransferase)
MSKEFALPDIGSGLQEAEIIEWHVAVGDTVDADQVLCEVETEKSVVEIPVPFGGVVLSLAGPAGSTVNVGETLVVIGEAGETSASPEPAAAATVSAGSEVLADSAAVAAIAVPSALSASMGATMERPIAMPLVRRLAKANGIDLAGVTGTGVGGRITRKDIEAVIAQGAAVPAATSAPVAASPARSIERVPLSKLRKAIGSHMTAQWQSVPHISAHVEADASRFISGRAMLSERLGIKLPVDAMLAAAVIPALRQFPVANAEIAEDDLIVKHYFDIGVAVGSDEGLLVPIVRDADEMSLADLAAAVIDLTSRAKDRKVLPDEMGNQTFTISNLGGLRGRHATQVIPAGTTGIVSFGRAVEQPVVRNGEIVAAPIMAISGTFDHRAMDGIEVMGVLNAIVEVIEEPALMLL